MTKVALVANTDWYIYNYRLSLANYLRDHGHEVILVSPPGRYTASFQENNFRWLSWSVGRQTISPWTEISAIKALHRLYRQEGVDLAHHHTIKPVLYGSIAARRLGLRNVVNSITGRGYVFQSSKLQARLLKPFAEVLYRLAFSYPNYAAIFETESDRQYFVEKGLASERRSRLISGVGVDTERFKPAPESGGPPIVLLPGRMLWEKGVGVLVEAARILKSKISVSIALVGDPDPGNPGSIPKEQLLAWVGEGVLEWWGWHDDMSQIYPKCHVVTLPTFYGEGTPTALIEAASCSRPIVATDIPGCRQVVQHGVNGLLVPPNDPLALAGALEVLISDPDLRGRMGAAGREIALEKFTVDRVNAATMDVYLDVLAGSQTRSH